MTTTLYIVTCIVIMIIAMIGFYAIVKFLFNKMEKNHKTIDLSPEIVEKLDHWIEYIISISPDAISSVNEDKQYDETIDRKFELDSESKKTVLEQTQHSNFEQNTVSDEPSNLVMPESSFDTQYERPSSHYQLPLQFDEKAE